MEAEQKKDSREKPFVPPPSPWYNNTQIFNDVKIPIKVKLPKPPDILSNN